MKYNFSVMDFNIRITHFHKLFKFNFLVCDDRNVFVGFVGFDAVGYILNLVCLYIYMSICIHPPPEIAISYLSDWT